MMRTIIDRIRDTFSWERISHYLAEDLLPDLMLALLIMTFFYVFWRVLRRVFAVGLARSPLDLTAREFVQAVLKYVVLTIGLVSALSQLGLDTKALLASLGVVGLTIGFAARDTLSNVISGLFIFWDRPFVVGDLVEIGDRYGRVQEITMRSTRVVTPDGKMLAVPNTNVVNSTVASYTNFPHLRLDIAVTIGVNEDLGRARRLLLDLVANDDRFSTEPAPVVVVTSLNDYNLAMELRAWIDDERQHVPMRFELREKAFEALRTAGVEMPCETLQLAPLEVRTTS